MNNSSRSRRHHGGRCIVPATIVFAFLCWIFLQETSQQQPPAYMVQSFVPSSRGSSTRKRSVIPPSGRAKQLHVQSFVSTGKCLFQRSTTTILPRIGDKGTCLYSSNNPNSWQGDVVPDAGGRIRGCTIQPILDDDDGSSIAIPTEWIVTIDGEEADLGRFSMAIYKKLITDAKQERFQGFRPGTIPPHLEPTYKAFAMDECARETVLEALQQNNIRPFTEARSTMLFDNFQIPPLPVKKGSKKKSKKSKKNAKSKPTKSKGKEGGFGGGDDDNDDVSSEEEENDDKEMEETPKPPIWRSFDSMKDAISAGWKPGQSFSFVATKVKGQRLKDVSATSGTEGASLRGLNID